MYVYLQTVGQGIDPDRFRVRLERVPIRTVEQLRYIKLCFDLCPELLNCCWLGEDREGNPVMELVVRCSWAYYQKQFTETK